MNTAIVIVSDLPGLLEMLLKLGLAAALGGVIGWERERHGRPAGVRTYMLIVTGCTLFTELSKQFGGADPARVAAQVVTGIGFLGAGAIMRRGGEIRGLTTAAGIWMSAAIGMAVGIGGDMYLVAVTATILAVLTLGVMDVLVVRVIAPKSHCELEIRLRPNAAASQVFAAVDEAGVELVYSRRTVNPEGDSLSIGMMGSDEAIHLAIERLASLPDVTHITREH